MTVNVSYLDESDRGGPFFTVGALMAKADEEWLPFSDRWQAVLDAPPAIRYFTLKDRQGLPDKARWAKIDAFIEVINEVSPRGALQTIHTRDFQDLYRGKMNATYDNPFQMGYMLAIQQLALWRLNYAIRTSEEMKL